MDFGCGSKPYKSIIQVEDYIGVDFENEGHPHHNEQIDVFYDGKKIPFNAETFDSVLCSEVFEHVFNLDEILLELNRVLKPGGKMLATCPFVWNEHEVPHDFARYTRFALEDKLAKAGFTVLEFTKVGNFITVVFQLITLYFYQSFIGNWRRIMPLRVLYKVCCFFLPNLLGRFLSRILPYNDTLYLNNVIVVQKKDVHENGR